MAKDNLKDQAEHYIDVLNSIKNTLYDSIKEHNCLEKQKECLLKIDMFNKSSELLKNIFNIKEKV